MVDKFSLTICQCAKGEGDKQFLRRQQRETRK